MYQPKTLEKIKSDMLERVKPQGHPMEGTREEDVRQACQMLKSLEGDHWAQVWSEVARPYAENGQKQESAGNQSGAMKNYLLAYNYYRIGRFAVPNSKEKKIAFHASVANFLSAARFFFPPLEKVEIPFDGKKGEGKIIPVYVQKPTSVNRPPVMIIQGGVDAFKEDQMMVTEAMLKKGIAVVLMDMPGTGECPVLGSTDAERLYDTVISYVQTRSDMNSSRIGFMGRSFGGYWATRIAHVELKRLAAVVNWGGGSHYAFQPEWQAECRYAPSHLGNDDLVITRAHAFGIYNYDEWVKFAPGLSLLTRGILDRPCAPLLIVNGKDDAHYPIEDIYILLQHGSPKTVRLFPGGHMGNTPQTLPTIIEWLTGRLCDGSRNSK